MVQNFVISQELDENDDNVVSLDPLRELRGIGLGFLSGNISHPNCDHVDRQTQRRLKSLKPQIVELVNKGNAYFFWEVFEAVYGGYDSKTFQYTVRQNEWTGQILVDGKPTTSGALLRVLEKALKTTTKLTDAQFKRHFEGFIEDRGFNPVKEYLGSLDATKPWGGWDSLAKEVFGVEDDLSQKMLSKWLIGAVARALDPGCQMRQCLTLQGLQEAGKTQFLRALAGSYYTSRDSEMSDADVYRQIGTCWIMELEELDAIISKRSVANLKRFISAQEDPRRKLYHEEIKEYPRHNVFAATVNDAEFLRDPSGNSRFWVIKVPGDINVDYVKANRDLIWAEALRRYEAGEAHWDKETSQDAQERSLEHTVANEFTEVIEAKLDDLSHQGELPVAFSASDLMFSLDLSITQHTKATHKVAQALRSLGYEKRSIRVGSKISKLWALPDAKPDVMIWKAHEWMQAEPKSRKGS